MKLFRTVGGVGNQWPPKASVYILLLRVYSSFVWKGKGAFADEAGLGF